MARPASIRKSKLARAIIELRERLDMNQERLAGTLECALPSLGRWEISVIPGPVILMKLRELARREGNEDLAEIFQQALEKHRSRERTKVGALDQDFQRWNEIEGELVSLAGEVAGLNRPDIQNRIQRLDSLVKEAKAFSWKAK